MLAYWEVEEACWEVVEAEVQLQVLLWEVVQVWPVWRVQLACWV